MMHSYDLKKGSLLRLFEEESFILGGELVTTDRYSTNLFYIVKVDINLNNL